MKKIGILTTIISLLVMNHHCFAQAVTIEVLNEDGTQNANKAFCIDQKNKIKATITGVASPFVIKWIDSNNKEIPNKSNLDVIENLKESGKYTVVVNDTNGKKICSDNVTIKINPLPVFQNVSTIVSGDNISIITQTDDNASNTFSWTSPSGASINPVSATQFIYLLNGAKISDLGTYKLKITNTNNCSIEKSIKVPEEPKIEPKPSFGLDTEEEDSKSFNYSFTRDCPIYQCDILGNLLSNQITALPISDSNYPKFTLLDEKDDYVIIKFWRWTNAILIAKYNENNGLPIYFRMSKQDLLTKTRKTFRVWFREGASHITAGTLIIPVKLRFNKFDFSKDITLGPFVGWRTRLHKSSQSFISIGFNVGITSVTLNEGNAVKEDNPNNPNNPKIEKNVDLAAFTWSYGAILEFNKVQIGVFSGYDNISENSGYKWNYQNKPWLSIGLGYSILSRNGNSKKQSVGNN
jgi:hypothetical protein